MQMQIAAGVKKMQLKPTDAVAAQQCGFNNVTQPCPSRQWLQRSLANNSPLALSRYASTYTTTWLTHSVECVLIWLLLRAQMGAGTWAHYVGGQTGHI
jgi:hypothetical protein